MFLVILILAAASFVTSVSGFGYALVATPFMTILFPPQIAVPVVMLTWLPLAALLVSESYRQISRQRLGLMLAGGIPGVPIGAYGLATMEESTMRAAIGVTTLVASMTFLVKPVRPIQRELLGTCVAGFLSGIFGGASAMSGPPVVLFGLNQRWNYRQFRADLISFFAVLHVVMLICFWDHKLLDQSSLKMSGWGISGLMVGYVSGLWVRPHVSESHFRTLALGLMSFGGILVLMQL